jgi:phosphopantothenoylcysteine decarboxylase/phosphopantothenate--cysteine ligase
MKIKGLRVLVTAGPTREFLDPVRFLSNPSSGKMGFAIAEEGVRRGARVTLVTGPVALGLPACRVVRVVSAAEMYRAVLREASRAELIVMTAAVSDYRPASFSRRKLKKADKPLFLKLVRTKDILKELGRRKKPGQILLGFAAETHRVKEHALEKLRKKHLDVIVANRVGASGGGFESDANAAVLLTASGRKKSLRPMTKKKMAKEILDFLAYSPEYI